MLRNLSSCIKYIKDKTNSLININNSLIELEPCFIGAIRNNIKNEEQPNNTKNNHESIKAHSIPLIIRLLAVPKKKVSPYRRRLRWRDKWLKPKFDITVCSYCGKGMLPHQVQQCCLRYREWRAMGNKGTPPEYVKISFRERKRRKEKEMREEIEKTKAKQDKEFKEVEEILKSLENPKT